MSVRRMAGKTKHLLSVWVVLAALVLAGNLIVEVVSTRLDPRVAMR